jgi:parallel beta-helix repeat protein
MDKMWIVLICLAIGVFGMTIGSVSAETITVCSSGCNFTEITPAIDAADNGDTVYVQSGTYNEQLHILDSINLVGEDKATTILDGDLSCLGGGRSIEVIRVTAENVNISGFTIINGYTGITLDVSSGCTITDTNIWNNLVHGIHMSRSENNVIRSNNISGSLTGISISRSNANLIFDNLFIKNTINAIDDGSNDWDTSYDCSSGQNIIGGGCLGGNYWSDYNGTDISGDGIGDTELPYKSTKNETTFPDWRLRDYILNGGDYLPLTLTSGEACATLIVEADKHTVQGKESYPPSVKNPIVGMEVRVFDKAQILNDGLSASWHNYENIWHNYIPVSSGITDDEGMVTFSLLTGDYMVIGNYTNASDEYPEPQTIFIGISASDLACGQTMRKYLQVIERADGKKLPAKYTKKIGSVILIIEPEFVEWNGTSALYPFVFDSIGDWNITTSVEPPEGFVSDYYNLSEEVITEVEAVQFNITDVGSEWVDTLVTHDLKHKDKKYKIKTKIGVKKSKDLEKKHAAEEAEKDKAKDKGTSGGIIQIVSMWFESLKDLFNEVAI